MRPFRLGFTWASLATGLVSVFTIGIDWTTVFGNHAVGSTLNLANRIIPVLALGGAAAGHSIAQTPQQAAATDTMLSGTPKPKEP